MIRAVCLNPVIDRTYHISGFTAGKLYMNNEPTVTVGGKGINAARVCKKLGAQVAVYGFIAGLNGQFALKDARTFADETYLYEVPGETRMTINIIDSSLQHETEILEKGPSGGEGDTEKLLRGLTGSIQPGDVVICSGLSIPGAPPDIYVHISALCDQAGAKCLLDTRGIDLKHALAGHYHMIKPNRQELEELIDEGQFDDLNSLCARAGEKLLDHTDYLLVSLGAQGSVLLSPSVFYRAGVPVVPVVSTIGSGDSTVGGFATALSQGKPVLDAFRLAMACGVSNSMNQHVADVRTDQVALLLPQIQITSM